MDRQVRDLSLMDSFSSGRLGARFRNGGKSVSVLLDSGEAFVGDLAMNAFPLRLMTGLPIFAENMQMVRQSWKTLLDRGAKTVYPAHGEPFPVGILQNALLEYQPGR